MKRWSIIPVLGVMLWGAGYLKAQAQTSHATPDAAFNAFTQALYQALHQEFPKPPRLAVLALTEASSGQRSALGIELESRLEQALIRQRSFSLVPAHELEALKASWKTETNQEFSAKAALAQGQAVQAGWILTGQIRDFPKEEKLQVALTLKEVSQGQALYAETLTLDRASLPSSLFSVASELAVAPASAPPATDLGEPSEAPVPAILPNPPGKLLFFYEYSHWSKFQATLNDQPLQAPAPANESLEILRGESAQIVLDPLLQSGDNTIHWHFINRKNSQEAHCFYVIQIKWEQKLIYQRRGSEFSDCQLNVQEKIVLNSTRPAMQQIIPRQETLKPFWIDRLEVTAEDYGAFRRARGEKVSLPTQPHAPATQITWSEAQAFCQAQKKRLPTAAEWLYAAGAEAPTPYPWGTESPAGGWFSKALANFQGEGDGFAQAAPVDSFIETASPFGLLNLLGNAAEWTASGENGQYQVLGGSWQEKASDWKNPQFLQGSTRQEALGFRCAQTAE